MKTVITAIAIALFSFLGISNANAQHVRAHVVVGAPIPGGHVVIHAGSPHYYHHYYRYHYAHPYYGYRRYYYHDYDRVWMPGHWDWDGDWIPGHWEWR